MTFQKVVLNAAPENLRGLLMAMTNVLQSRLETRYPHVYAVDNKLLVDERYVFVLNRFLQAFSALLGDGYAEISYAETCQQTQIPTWHLCLSNALQSEALDALLDEVQTQLWWGYEKHNKGAL